MKKITYLILALFFSICSRSSFAQQIILPQDLDGKRATKAITESVDFVAYPYLGDKIDLRHFKEINPELDAPDFLEINSSYLSPYYELTVLIGLIKGVIPTEEAIVIWLAANYDTNEVTFFLDEGLTRQFSREGQKVKLSYKDKPKEVIIRPLKSNLPNIKLLISVPVKKDLIKEKDKSKKKIINKFAIGFHTGVGIERLDYRFDNIEKGFPTWYSINMTEKNIGTSFSFNLKKWRFALEGSFQGMYSYTSYLNIQYDVPRVISNPSTGGPQIIESIQVERNQDKHSTNRFQYGGTIGYRIHPSKLIELQPFISVGKLRYFDDYVGDRFEEGVVYEMPSTFYQAIGLRTEFVSGNSNSIYINLLYQLTFWRPTGFFEVTPFENLEIDNRTWKFLIGYRFGL